MTIKDRTTIQLSEPLRKELKILSSKRDISYQDLLRDMIDIFKELDKERTIISIPTKLADKIKHNIKDTDMKSVSEYIIFILRMILSQDTKTLSKKEEQIIKQRLRSLGYLE